jgi:hypothetical protein
MLRVVVSVVTGVVFVALFLKVLSVDASDGTAAFFEVVVSGDGFLAPDEVPSGWVTYRLRNETAYQMHEISLARLPEGKTQADYIAEAVPVWEAVMRRVQSGELKGYEEVAAAAAELLPGWVDDVHYVRARGIVSPGRSTQNTIYLESGNYALSCWLKAADGTLHIARGMSRPLQVTGTPSLSEPSGVDVEVIILDGEVQTKGALTADNQVIALHLGGDYDNVHLVRIVSETDLAPVIEWMDWYTADGLRAPAPVEFLGGVHAYGNESPTGRVYFTVEAIKPGEYAWIVEAPVSERMWKRFVVE